MFYLALILRLNKQNPLFVFCLEVFCVDLKVSEHFS